MTGLRHAFKEWAVICNALASGRQALVLRKGGIAEDGGAFRVEHTRFWLYPTYLHEKPTGVRPEAAPLLVEAERERPPAGTVRLTHFAEVPGVYRVGDLAGAMSLTGLHLWSDDTVQQKFAYRAPGLFVLPVRVYRATEPVELPETPYYAGCKSWVELERDLSTEGATPVLTDEAFRSAHREIEVRLRPTAFA